MILFILLGMLSKSKGQILRISAALHVLFQLQMPDNNEEERENCDGDEEENQDGDEQENHEDLVTSMSPLAKLAMQLYVQPLTLSRQALNMLHT